MEQHLIDRFWSKVNKSGACWVWTGPTYGNGYGMFKPHHQGKSLLAHRVSYELEVGPIPDGLTIDHLCRNHACVNPAHLEPVTKRENTLRGIGPAAVHAQQTHCKHGHPFSPENTWVDKTGARHCRTCMKAAYARNMPKYKDEYNRRRRERRVPSPLGKSRKGIPHKVTKPMSDETRRKLSASHQGVPRGPMSDETKRKLSESRKAMFARRRAETEHDTPQ